MSKNVSRPLSSVLLLAAAISFILAGCGQQAQMKQRLLEFLVEKMGFTLFAMEWSWSTGEQINDYVLNGQGDIRAILEQQGFWIWKTQELLDLLQWMRA